MTISGLRSGIFHIAYNYNIPIIPVVISSLNKTSIFLYEKQYELFLGLGKKEARYYSVYKKDYFNIISPRIGIVNKRVLTSMQLYKAASKQ